MGVVAARQLKNHTGEILRRVRAGETLTVTVRGVAVAKFVPARSGARGGAASGRRTRQAAVRAVAGKYRGFGTLREFLDGKPREKDLER
jgi:prevent-host-death family protein